MVTLVDGLGFEELAPSGVQASGTVTMHPYFLGSITTIDQISGANIYSTTNIIGENVYGDTVVSGATIKGTTINNSQGTLKSVSVGSGTGNTYGAFVQAGSATLSSNNVWVVYPVAYAGKPTVAVANLTSQSGLSVFTGSLTAGSFCCKGDAASDDFSWVSIGI